MEPIEDTDGESHVTQYGPDIWSIELYLDSLVVIAPDQEGLHDVDGQVGHNQERDHVTRFHLSLCGDTVGTSPESVHDHWSLYENLNHNQKVSEEESSLKLSIK